MMQINIACLVSLLICCCAEQQDAIQYYALDAAGSSEAKYVDTVAHILCATYPESIESCDTAKVVFTNGNMLTRSGRMRTTNYSDLSAKEYKHELDCVNIDTQVLSGRLYSKDYYGSLINIDPGRMRDEEFFKAMYGNDPSEVMKNMTYITWMPGVSNRKLLFTTVNSADIMLKKVSDELVALPKKYSKYVNNVAGTYVWRKISGTNRLSAHSFGIAIDINISHSNYWKWDQDKGKWHEYRNEIPKKIVDIFERHGFIWGGRWYHYDTMHFEPEILYFANHYTLPNEFRSKTAIIETK